ncbi:MAG TPA: 2OG-Fe(II) oxygenase [Caulobacteraceae bacterium]|nr:2OG-Fe(II) oxygenase [Caulobacteraceae bacterium]
MVRTKGRELSEAYNKADPFPHTIIDDFLPPSVLEDCLKEFPANLNDGDVQYDRSQERLKSQFNPDSLSDGPRRLFYSFNSKPFVQVLENITGIKGLIPDPHFLGAGFHNIAEGGHLSVHADFNHHKPMDLERRINLLIYLNKDWSDDYGGQLELWDTSMAAKVQSVVPLFNRCVIFNTTSESYHGNPRPVNHPKGVSRKSIALYYYTATWSAAKREHTTQFKPRPGQTDKVDTQVRISELLADITPPILRRTLVKTFRGQKKSA